MRRRRCRSDEVDDLEEAHEEGEQVDLGAVPQRQCGNLLRLLEVQIGEREEGASG